MFTALGRAGQRMVSLVMTPGIRMRKFTANRDTPRSGPPSRFGESYARSRGHAVTRAGKDRPA